jgi:hypothetical protein
MRVPHVWIANPARFVPLFSYAGEAPRGYQPTVLPRHWPAKRSTDLLDYGLDCSEHLAHTGDTIASFALALDPSDMQALLVCQIGGALIAWLGSGTPGTDYAATWSIGLASGQDIVAPVTITVSAAPGLVAPALPSLSVRPDQAAPLLARDGTPLLPANGALTYAATTHDGAALEVEGGGILTFR